MTTLPFAMVVRHSCAPPRPTPRRRRPSHRGLTAANIVVVQRPTTEECLKFLSDCDCSEDPVYDVAQERLSRRSTPCAF